ncbi:Alpha-1,6-fucosyltransferase [Hondaea fermentalgiana]|uniref:Alpha-1,6-fucosyltransferase n=1 Tax=Hondaea fermentalgiana TaxID=2315210 RepID=A0A2R5GY02_9STRA|nr:Alpha-1,6-fucosyltransferase [Hondaea fermentalgiana]|eukprot:GBG34678.1 Alpha-1,6-fucosyltransferase [Hondaea fermentalgiana]
MLRKVLAASLALALIGLVLLLRRAANAEDLSQLEGIARARVKVNDELCARIAQVYHLCPENHLFPTLVLRGVPKEVIACDFNIAKDLEYLPDAELLACLETYKPVEWEKDAARLQKHIHELQNPKDCKQPKSTNFLKPDWEPTTDAKGNWAREDGTGKLVDMEKPKWHLLNWLNHGWAYNLFVFSWSAGNHWIAGIPVITGNSKYRFTDWACGRGYSCELSPLSSCAIEDVDPSGVLVYGLGMTPKNVMTLDQVCKPHGEYLMRYGRCDCEPNFIAATDAQYSFCKPYSAIDLTIERKRQHVKFYEENRKTAIQGDEVWFANNAPGEENPYSDYNEVHFGSNALREKHGFLWQHAQSLYYLLNKSRKKELNDGARERLGLTARNARCVGVHVRHGDSCHDKFQNHRVCLPLSRFIEGVRKLELRYGKYDKVFLATDDPDVIADAKTYADEFDIVYQSQDRKFYETGDDIGVDVREDFNTPSRVNEIASDIWTLSHCDAFVGSFASSVAWISYEYMAAQKGFYPPFVSVDLAYGHKKNVGRFLDKGPNE